ncbi:hypothetical protein L0V05_05480 [Tabrizicola sp. J26]|uniref:hypothetical protein n=1 Tax=Alitabrizicola rongguiensis TaxID=2909234 RepID=UPI001F1A018E|nr:hypothetical protein [Tabrizicola rongguiensis]MCF1708268.1 hypothetical protein [Tabrizicola rongguiensis]
MKSTNRKSPPAADAPVASEADVMKMLDLLKGSTSVELKLTLPDTNIRPAIQRLGFDPVEAEPRQCYFFDTKDLDLQRAGLVVRARRIQGGAGDSAIKLRPVDPAAVDPELRRSPAFKIELDAMPGGHVCSASFKGVCSGEDVRSVAEGSALLSTLFSKDQRAFFAEHAPEGIDLDSLVPLGPTFLLRVKEQPKKYDRRVTVELWLYPDGSRIFEISTKAQPREAFQAAAEFRAFIKSCGIPIVAVDSMKTRTALEYFSKEPQDA